jgi:alpha-1,2-mannosyltransferase
VVHRRSDVVRRRIFVRRNALILTFLLAYVLGGIVSEYWLGLLTRHPLGEDFRIYYDAYVDARNERNPYLPYSIGHSFIYHPFALTFISVFTWHGNWTLAFFAWTLGGAVSWGAAVSLVLRIIEAKSPLVSQAFGGWDSNWFVWLVFLVFAPFWETIHIGQINVFVALFLYLSLYLDELDRPLAAGLCLAVSILLKTSPILFLGYFWIARRYRVVWSTLAALAGLNIVPAVQFSARVLSDYCGILGTLGSEIHPTVYNQSMIAISSRILGHLGIANAGSMLILSHRILFLGLGTVVLIRCLLTPADHRSARRWLFGLFLIAMVVSSPLVWYHHSLFLLLPLVQLILSASRVYAGLGVALVFVLQMGRLFEYGWKPIALPVLFAQVSLLVIFIWGLWKNQEQRERYPH